MTHKVILILGPPCSGKSSIINYIDGHQAYRVTSNDILRLQYIKKGRKTELYSPEFTHQLYLENFEIINQLNFENSVDILVEGMFLSNIYRKALVDSIGTAYFEPFLILCDLSIALERLDNRKDTDAMHNISPLGVNKLMDLFNNYTQMKALVPDTNIIDTSAISIQEAGDYILSKIVKREFNKEDINIFIQ